MMLLWCRLKGIAGCRVLLCTCRVPVPKQRRLHVPLSHKHSPSDVVRQDLGGTEESFSVATTGFGDIALSSLYKSGVLYNSRDQPKSPFRAVVLKLPL